MYGLYLDGCLFPIAPSSFVYQVAGRNTVVDLMNDGQINEMHLPNLFAIQMEIFLPDVALPYALYEDYFHNSRYYLKKIENLANAGVDSVQKKSFDLQLIRSRDGQIEVSSDDINLKVCLDGYRVKESVEEGPGVTVSLNFTEYRAMGTTVISIEASGNLTAQKTREVPQNAQSTSYTVVKGDTLWGIAKKKLNNATRANEIYKLNATVIESAAKKNKKMSSSNGYWLYAGTVLTLPSI